MIVTAYRVSYCFHSSCPKLVGEGVGGAENENFIETRINCDNKLINL